VLPVGQRYSGKNETHVIERDNARQRHWRARFRRHSIVVSKAKRMVEVSLALLACFAVNDRIGSLLSMLTKTLEALCYSKVTHPEYRHTI
jgi:insertion element IS1 protein InsB